NDQEQACFRVHGSCRRRDRETADLVSLDEAGDETRRLCLFDKLVEVGGARGVCLRRSDRLLHRAELAFDDPGARNLLDIGEEPRPQARERLEIAANELLGRAAETIGPDQLGVPDIAIEPETIRT